MEFELGKELSPKGDQKQAIDKLVDGFCSGYKKQTLLGITGSGKTFTMANVISHLKRPTLIISHNKTLASQLYSELKRFFPKNAVEYFVSYYDYYQPESYLPTTDTYIEKDADINEKIEQMRLKATASLMTRKDTIIVASVSCIYGLGSPVNFRDFSFDLKRGQKIRRDDILRDLVDDGFERNDKSLSFGRFRVRGDIIDIMQGFSTDEFIRIEMFGDQIDTIRVLDILNNSTKYDLDSVTIFPARHYVSTDEEIERAMRSIREELKLWHPEILKKSELFAHRLKQKVNYDLEMISTVGFCSGIENYSRHFEGRKEGEPPFCLIDFFPDDFLLIIDESHQTIPQLHGMYHGDYTRKKNLIDYGFRLPSAFDNRPLKFEEFKKTIEKKASTLFVSATPANWEIEQSNRVAEQIIRPTGLLDPTVDVRKTNGQIDDLIKEIEDTVSRKNRILVTTLTKRMAEDLTNYLSQNDIKVRYLHSEIDTLERTELIRQLRLKKFDCLVGINLLREGLDIPEVELVAILDADKEGFLRNETSLIQTIGRASRNANGRVIMYADVITESMEKAISITEKRRKTQIDYNKKHGIIPKTIIKAIEDAKIKEIKDTKHIPKKEIPKMIIELETEMKKCAEELNFERAIEIRDRIEGLRGEVTVFGATGKK